MAKLLGPYSDGYELPPYEAIVINVGELGSVELFYDEDTEELSVVVIKDEEVEADTIVSISNDRKEVAVAFSNQEEEDTSWIY